MKTTFSFILASCVAAVLGQGVTDPISPSGSAPAGCSTSYDGSFEVTVVKVAVAKRDAMDKRTACSSDGTLVATLSDGILKDSKSRTGYIASNFQFQYDGPPQAGALYTAGFSACSNGSIALGSSTTFYACVSGDFSNLYDRSWAAQCSPVEVLMIPCGGSDTAPGGEVPDGQIVGTQIITTTVVSAISDGQPQVVTKTVPVPLCQITDGQLQAHTTPCASLPTVASTSTPAALPPPVSQFSDGQIQVTPPGSVPTVTSAPSVPAVTTPKATTPASAPASSPAASVPAGSSPASVPASSGKGTVPVTTPKGSSTLATSKASTAASSTASSPATSAPVTSSAGAVQRGSMAAFIIVLIGAVAML